MNSPKVVDTAGIIPRADDCVEEFFWSLRGWSTTLTTRAREAGGGGCRWDSGTPEGARNAEGEGCDLRRRVVDVVDVVESSKAGKGGEAAPANRPIDYIDYVDDIDDPRTEGRRRRVRLAAEGSRRRRCRRIVEGRERGKAAPPIGRSTTRAQEMLIPMMLPFSSTSTSSPALQRESSAARARRRVSAPVAAGMPAEEKAATAAAATDSATTGSAQ